MSNELNCVLKFENGESISFDFDKVASDFIIDNKPFMNIIGPVGSGKDFTCYCKLIFQSTAFQNSRYVIIKQGGYEQFKRYFNINQMIFDDNKKIATLKDNQVAEFIFLEEIDDANTLHKVLHLELTGAFIETCNKNDDYIHNIISILTQRVGRYPNKREDKGFLYNNALFLTNGYKALELKEDSFINTLFENYYQPNGDSVDAENQDNLPKDYYKNLIVDAPEYYINKFIKTDKSS